MKDLRLFYSYYFGGLINLEFDEDTIIKKICRIREEIGHENIKPDILDLMFNEKTRELFILTSDRPEKSLVIGKGGWVVGKLKEELNINRIHVESYSDVLIRKHRVKLAYNKLNGLIKQYNTEKLQGPLENLSNLLKNRIEYPYGMELLLKNRELETTEPSINENLAVVALSGGVDSSSSLIIAKLIGLNPLAVTVNPGDIILPKYFRESVNKLSSNLNIEHKYLEVEMSPVVEGALNGRYHPCGRCSKIIENTVLNYAQKLNIPLMIFGDLLATGNQSMVFKDDVLRINLPALFSATKSDTKKIAGKFGINSTSKYGCPLLGEVQKKYPHMRRFSIQRILRETRAGVLESGEALDMIMKSM